MSPALGSLLGRTYSGPSPVTSLPRGQGILSTLFCSTPSTLASEVVKAQPLGVVELDGVCWDVLYWVEREKQYGQMTLFLLLLMAPQMLGVGLVLPMC